MTAAALEAIEARLKALFTTGDQMRLDIASLIREVKRLRKELTK